MAQGGIGTAPARPLQVLVVDDSQALRSRARLALERAGLAVVGEAADGAQALAQAAEHRPDVVLMDLRMPGMNGIQATRILRRRQPDTPVVLWSAEDDTGLDRAVRRSGARAGLAKDAGTAELVAAVHRVCEAPDGAGGDPGAAARLKELGPAEWAALEQLAAADGYATRWPVGRRVTRSLTDRGLVVMASDYVLLTEAGRLALDAHDRQSPRPAPPDLDRADHDAAVRPVPVDPVVVTARRPVVGVASAG
jgi:DNA-binding NarL/FixJ family response regulator